MVGIVFALGFVDVPDVEVAGIGVCDVCLLYTSDAADEL